MNSRLLSLLLLCPVAVHAQDDNRLGFSGGVVVAVEPKSYGSTWGILSILDDDSRSGWASPNGDLGPHAVVLELPTAARMTAFEFDTRSVDGAGRAARDVVVEVSDQSAEAGFRQVLKATLKNAEDSQRFPVAAPVAGRWVRLTIVNNYGDAQYNELMGFRGLGTAQPAAPLPDVSGTYQTNYSFFRIRQQGSAVIGCYEHDEGLLEGTMEGRVAQLTWRETGGPNDRGPVILVFAPDGSSFRGQWWYLNGEKGPPSGNWDGARKSSDVGTCPHWSGSVGSELRRTLSTERRAKLYGILFDVNAATIRSESNGVLDEVATLMKAETTWKLLIEGHTDAQGSDASNQTLSEARAKSVQAALVSRGVAAARLRAQGFGESTPVGDNATSLGRAQNRRVELVRE
jgi:outer membrane protein OmpA-like peptidoglycan-associated protein